MNEPKFSVRLSKIRHFTVEEKDWKIWWKMNKDWVQIVKRRNSRWLDFGYSWEKIYVVGWGVHGGVLTRAPGRRREKKKASRSSGQWRCFFFCIRRSFDGGAFYSSQLVGSQHSQVRILQVMSMGQQLQPRWIGLALLILGLASPSWQSSPDYHDELENTAVNTNDADVFGYYGPPSNYLENVSFLHILSLTHFDSIGLASLEN